MLSPMLFSACLSVFSNYCTWNNAVWLLFIGFDCWIHSSTFVMFHIAFLDLITLCGHKLREFLSEHTVNIYSSKCFGSVHHHWSQLFRISKRFICASFFLCEMSSWPCYLATQEVVKPLWWMRWGIRRCWHSDRRVTKMSFEFFFWGLCCHVF